MFYIFLIKWICLTQGRPSTVYYHRFIGTMPLLRYIPNRLSSSFGNLFSQRFLNIPIAVGLHFSGYLSIRSVVIIFAYRLRSTLWASQSFKRTVIFGWPRIVTVYIATHPRLTLRSSSCISTGGNIDPYIRVFVSALSAHSNHIYFIDARTILCSPTDLSCTFSCATANFMRLLLAYNHLFLREQIAISSISGRFWRTITFSFPDSQQQLG